MRSTWYSTQGGGKAQYVSGELRFTEAPKWDRTLLGKPVPKEWGIQGPFYEDGAPEEPPMDEEPWSYSCCY